HMIRAMLAGHGGRAVAAAVVNDEPFDDLETVHRLGQVAQRRRERAGLVETGNLNDQLHRRTNSVHQLELTEEESLRRPPLDSRARVDRSISLGSIQDIAAMRPQPARRDIATIINGTAG